MSSVTLILLIVVGCSTPPSEQVSQSFEAEVKIPEPEINVMANPLSVVDSFAHALSEGANERLQRYALSDEVLFGLEEDLTIIKSTEIIAQDTLTRGLEGPLAIIGADKGDISVKIKLHYYSSDSQTFQAILRLNDSNEWKVFAWLLAE
ncbi:hypothetical protein [Penaeicola halotolerans]|uniref:hypothetical protein n=1 Tax=Penaeicola halotolerans TaxID=2793196 RepID=UPI001CF86E66|nr:hypothetical protein [Penaeicola halotolerans]